MPGHSRIKDVELFVGITQWNVSHRRIQVRTRWIPAVIVTERAATLRVDRRMPSGVHLAIRPDGGVSIVLFLSARIEGRGSPSSECDRGVLGPDRHLCQV
jgi:hypothetical protein